ncbi:hypothetical protein MYX06_04870 [Patescibacteria group bacterium AH-259-L05]|nr:hypothetical protein [Patescibacteria group bacterium AH-259-L05]
MRKQLFPIAALLISLVSFGMGEDLNSDTTSTDVPFWEPITGFYNEYISAIDINIFDHIFVGVRNIGSISSSGVYSSTDYGNTWNPINGWVMSDGSSLIHCLVVNVYGDIFVGTGDGIFRSRDNGTSWTQVIREGESGSLDARSLVVTRDNEIFVGTWRTGVLYSRDNGDTWAQVKEGLPDFPVMHLAADSYGQVFAGTMIRSKIFRFTSADETWEEIGPDTLGEYDAPCLAVNSTGEIFAGFVHNGVYYSRDYGNTWIQSNDDKIRDKTIISLLITSNDHIFVGTQENGIYYSTDNGETWEQINNGLMNLFISTIAVDTYGYVFVGTKKDGLYRSREPIDEWHK